MWGGKRFVAALARAIHADEAEVFVKACADVIGHFVEAREAIKSGWHGRITAIEDAFEAFDAIWDFGAVVGASLFGKAHENVIEADPVFCLFGRERFVAADERFSGKIG